MRHPLLRPALPLAALLAAALSGCGGPVAPNAPALLGTDEIAARAAMAQDTTRGARAASELAWRGARLRARADAIRRAGLHANERASLIRRAEDLKAEQG
ncbi:MAG: hypothetical protein Kow0013_10580 [Pararhodobacter sp.]